uniref:Uncharacterized protein MANES_01G272900 n=1 Tax=Rhizophora mucronata TaxID=61149 RepID=A0A2P2LU63_RHIMU
MKIKENRKLYAYPCNHSKCHVQTSEVHSDTENYQFLPALRRWARRESQRRRKDKDAKWRQR